MNKIHISNLKRLKLLALTGLVLSRGNVTTLAEEVNSPQIGVEYEVRGNPKYADQLSEVIDGLDDNIKDYINRSNLKVVVLDGEDSAEEVYTELEGYNPGHITGFLDDKSDSKCIYVEGSDYQEYYDKYPNSSNGLTREDFNFRIVRDTFLHELGHFLDGGLDENMSRASEFQGIYYEEINGFTNTLEYKIDNFGIYANVSDPANYFASAFSCYVAYPDSLKENCPRTYDFIDRVIKEKQYENVDLYKDDVDDYQLNIHVETWGNPEYAERLKYDLAHINKGLLKYYENRGFWIVILDGSKSAEDLYYQMFDYYYNSIRGFTALDNSGVYVEGCKMPGYYEKYAETSAKGLSEDEFNYRIARDTLIHEMAHCMDGGYSQYISGSSDFQSIYHTEMNNFTNTIEYKVDNLGCYTNISTSVEYFATAFACYVFYPESLRANCPRTYDFYDRIAHDLDYKYSVDTTRGR